VLSEAEDLLELQLKAINLPNWDYDVPVAKSWVREYVFYLNEKGKPIRRWRFDFAFPLEMVAVEIEGGLYIRGRHMRGAGAEKDMEKYNRAELEGWTVLRFSPGMVKSGVALATVQEALG
jgi:very-short-patch-repair endonuclease